MIKLKKLSQRHKAIADLLVTSPHLSQGDIARIVGITETWLSLVKQTPIFQAHLSRRRKELVDDTIRVPPEQCAAAIAKAHGLPPGAAGGDTREARVQPGGSIHSDEPARGSPPPLAAGPTSAARAASGDPVQPQSNRLPGDLLLDKLMAARRRAAQPHPES